MRWLWTDIHASQLENSVRISVVQGEASLDVLGTYRRLKIWKGEGQTR